LEGPKIITGSSPSTSAARLQPLSGSDEALAIEMEDDGWFAVADEGDEDWTCSVQPEQDVAVGLANDWACRLKEENQRLRALAADTEHGLLQDDCPRSTSKMSRTQLETRRKQLAVLVTAGPRQQCRPITNANDNGAQAAAMRARHLLEMHHGSDHCKKTDLASERSVLSRNLPDGALVDAPTATNVCPSQHALIMPVLQANSSTDPSSKHVLRMAGLQAEHRVLKEAHAAAFKQLEDTAASLEEEQLLLDQFLDETVNWELRTLTSELQGLDCEEKLLRSQLLQAKRCPAATDALARALGNAAPAGMQREVLRQWWYLRPPRFCAEDQDGAVIEKKC